jgi:hypothetical protein
MEIEECMEPIVTIGAESVVCPSCSGKTIGVESITLKSLVVPRSLERVRDTTYRYCSTKSCAIVYFAADDPTQSFLCDDLKIRVADKETSESFPICYCFDWTTDDVRRELRDTSETTIPGRIERLIRLGFCRCETMNPKGRCCLGDVTRTVKRLKSEPAE